MKIIDSSRTIEYEEYKWVKDPNGEWVTPNLADPSMYFVHSHSRVKVTTVNYFVELDTMDALALGGTHVVLRIVSRGRSIGSDLLGHSLYITDKRNLKDFYKIPGSLMTDICVRPDRTYQIMKEILCVHEQLKKTWEGEGYGKEGLFEYKGEVPRLDRGVSSVGESSHNASLGG